jgi:hypothetical protein
MFQVSASPEVVTLFLPAGSLLVGVRAQRRASLYDRTTDRESGPLGKRLVKLAGRRPRERRF